MTSQFAVYVYHTYFPTRLQTVENCVDPKGKTKIPKRYTSMKISTIAYGISSFTETQLFNLKIATTLFPPETDLT